MVIVFDFDGTLADSLSVILDVYNHEVVPKWGLKPVSQEDWHRMRQSSIPKGMREVGVKPYQAVKLLNEGRRLIKARAHDIKLFPGAVDMINHLADQKHQMFVLSSNDQALVEEVLKAGGISSQLQVLKATRLFGKANSLRRLLRQTATVPSDAWMIGDEVRDMTAAKRAGMRSIAVTWGFQPEVVLAGLKPDAIVHSFSEIPKLLSA